MPITHYQLLKCMEELGYEVNSKGMCYGFAYMAAQAILLEDLETYNRRLYILLDIINKGLILNEVLQTVRDAIKERSQKITQIANRIKNQALKEKEKKILKEEMQKLIDELNYFKKENEDILSIPAFFDGVALHFNPAQYPNLFSENIPDLQNSELTFPLILPELFKGNHMDEKNKNLEQVSIKNVINFCGLYDDNELTIYFETLNNVFKDIHPPIPITFVMSNSNHTITMGYDIKTKTWQWVDVSNSKEITDAKCFVKFIRTSFLDLSNLSFNTQIYVNEKDITKAQKYVDLFKNQDDWKKIHDVTLEKIKNQNSVKWFNIAVRNGDYEVTEKLLKYGLDPNSIFDNNGLTPLIVASIRGNEKMVDLLLNYSANPNLALEEDNSTPLFFASQDNHFEIVNLLIEHSRKYVDDISDYLNQSRKDGTTALCVAAEKGNLKIAELLIDNNANIDINREDGTTPIFWAVKNGDVNLTKLFLDNKADSKRAYASESLLCIAAAIGNVEIAKLLLEQGGEINHARDDGATPLIIAAANGHIKMVEYLLKEGANPNLASTDGATPLFYASQYNHIDIATKLLTNNPPADLNLMCNDKATPFIIAVEKNHLKMCELLLKHGANINQSRSNDETPIFIAAANDYAEMVEFLLKRGAIPNKAREDGATALLAAVQNGNEKMVIDLLKAEVNLNQTYVSELKSVAQTFNNTKIIELLKQYSNGSVSSYSLFQPSGNLEQKTQLENSKKKTQDIQPKV